MLGQLGITGSCDEYYAKKLQYSRERTAEKISSCNQPNKAVSIKGSGKSLVSTVQA